MRNPWVEVLVDIGVHEAIAKIFCTMRRCRGLCCVCGMAHEADCGRLGVVIVHGSESLVLGMKEQKDERQGEEEGIQTQSPISLR